MTDESARSAPLLREIEGMRAVAVASVLLYHGGFGFSGGYVGVDVFFVLSGFLITSLLRREQLATGRISLGEFYARRARRLLPAATLVLLVTLVLADLLLDPLRFHQTAVDTLWAGGFLANFHFAAIGADYLQATRAPSLLQHWWSLAIEEQFYLVWPGLLGLAWRLGRFVNWIGLTLCVVIAGACFEAGLRLTEQGSVWGYFATWARGWELAAGGICAFLWEYRGRVPLRAAFGWLGLAAIGWSAVTFDGNTQFPGTAALWPVLGTAFVVLSIGAAGGPGLVLSRRPLMWLGGRSYGVYLWHWPLLMILHDRIEIPSALWRGGVLVGSIALAALSYVLLENPVRHLPALIRSSGRSMAMGALAVAVVVGSGAIISQATDDISFDTGYVAPEVASTTLLTPPTIGSSTPGTTLPPVPWSEQLEQKIITELQPLIASSATNDLLPDNITPRISDQADDFTKVYRDGCMVGFYSRELPPCEYGDLSSSFRVTLFGDSHADQWFPGLEAASVQNQWRLEVVTKMACPAVDVRVMFKGDSTYPDCDAWYPAALERIAASDTQLVIITSWRFKYSRNVNGVRTRMSDEAWRAGLEHTVSTLIAAGKTVLLLADSPYAAQAEDQCLAKNAHRITRCALDPRKALNATEIALEQQVAQDLGASYYDTSRWFCTPSTCPAVIGNMAVYLDTSHINNTYGLFLTPYLELVVKQFADVPVA